MIINTIKRIIFSLFLVAVTINIVKAETYYWIGNNNNWSDASKWSLTPNGSSINDVPTTGDTVVISSSIVLDINAEVSNLEVTAVTTVSINFDNPTIQFKALNLFKTSGNRPIIINGEIEVLGDFIQENTNLSTGGTGKVIFSGLNDQKINGHLTEKHKGFIPNVVVNKSSGNLSLEGYIAVVGSWEYISGTMDFSTPSTVSFKYGTNNAIGEPHFDNLKLSSKSTTYMNGNMVVEGNMTTSGNRAVIINGEIEVLGDFIQENTNISTGGTGKVIFSGLNDQKINGHLTEKHKGFIPNVVVNKSSGNLSLEGYIAVIGSWEYISGTMDFSTPSTVSFKYGTNNAIGEPHFDNLKLSSKSTTYMNGNMVVEGNMTTSGNRAVIINGEIEVLGDFIQENTNISTGGTGKVIFSGLNDQKINGHLTEKHKGFIPNVVVNKSSGNLSLEGYIAVIGSWEYISGTMDFSTPSTVSFKYGTNNAIGEPHFDNLKLSSKSTTYMNGNMVVEGNMTTSGNRAVIINGEIEVLGDFIQENTNLSTGGTGKVIFSGLNDQKINGHLTENHKGFIPNVVVNKSSGNLSLEGYIAVIGSWEYISGTMDFSTPSTVSFKYGTNNAIGEPHFDNLKLSSKSTTYMNGNMVVEGNMTTSGNRAVIINGEIEVLGDFIQENTNISTGGTGKVIFSGINDQKIYGSLNLDKGALPSVEINKPSGILCLQDLIKVKNDWIHTQGDVDTCCADTLFLKIIGNNGLIADCGYAELSAFAYVSHITANDDLNSGIIDVNPEGGEAPYNYQWETGETTKYINNLAQGKYIVTITDAGGQTIQKEYSIDYFVTAAVPNTFVLENNAIKKHPDSTSDKEMMVSENKLSDNDWVEASFSGEDIYFVFGLDPRKLVYLNSEQIEYGILTQNNQMYFIKGGNVISKLGQYIENQSLMLKRESGMLMIYMDGIQLGEYEIGTSELYSKVSLTKDKGRLFYWITSKYWKPSGENDFYATLTKKLDGSFYEMKNYIKFKYKEKYDDNVLDYKVYDWKRQIKMENTGVVGHKYGLNYHRIPAYTVLDSETDGYYTLEVTNDKKEVYKMRFFFEKEVLLNIPGVLICCDPLDPDLPVRDGTKQRSAIINPNNPVIVNTDPLTNNERRK